MLTIVTAAIRSRAGSALLAAAVAAAASGVYVSARASKAHEAELQKISSAHDLEMANINAAASAQQLENDARYQDAQNAAKTREISLRNDAASARAAADSMRITTARLRGENAELSREALALRASAGYVVLEQCTARYQRLAETADRHANDIRTLIDSWPH